MASRRSRRLDRGRTPLAVARRRPDLRSRRSGPEPERHTRRAAAHEEAPEISRDAARVMITDKLRSYGAARAKMGLFVEHRQQKGLNNRAENSHQPTRRRERIMKRFKSAPARAAVSSGSRSGRQPLPPSLSRLRPHRIPSRFARKRPCCLERELQHGRRRLNSGPDRGQYPRPGRRRSGAEANADAAQTSGGSSL
jgi:hypothetical protein